jgi:hypothetical protein
MALQSAQARFVIGLSSRPQRRSASHGWGMARRRKPERCGEPNASAAIAALVARLFELSER